MVNYIKPSVVVATVKALGLVVRYDSSYQEYRIDYRRSDSRWSEDSAYYTTYPDDAIETAKKMSEFQKG